METHIKFFAAIFVLFLQLNLFATPITVTEDDSDISLLEQSEVYIDRGASLSFDDIKADGQNFKSSGSDFISQGYTTDEAVWVRFTLRNASDKPLARVLHIDNSMLDTVTLYDANGSSETVGALARPPYDGIIDFYFAIDLPPEQSSTYYLRALSNSCATYFHLDLETKSVLWQKNLTRQLILSAFFALMTTLLVYNFIIFIFVRERVYLYYSLYLLFFIVNHSSYTGMTLPVLTHLFSPAKITWWAQVDSYLGIYYYSMIMIFMLLFARAFMQLRRFRLIDLVVKILLIASVVLILLSTHQTYLLGMFVYLSIVIMIILPLIALYLAFRREPNSLYYVFGWGISLGAILWFLFYNMGLYIPEGGYRYFYEIGVAAEALLFSIILSKRLNHAKALENALATQQVLLRELHHRVKNNLQFIVSFYRLKLKRHLDPAGKRMLTEAEQNVVSLGKIHEILYRQPDLTAIEASIFLKTLTGEIAEGFKDHPAEIRFEGEASLPVQQVIYCGLIVNELVTNAFKYAFEKNGGIITVRIGKDREGFRLDVEDNGKGFDTAEIGQTFGLTLVQHLVEKELGGSLKSATDSGTRHTIRWR